MIEMHGVSFRYREGLGLIVRDVNPMIPDGAVASITGTVGLDKSTLAYAMNGIISCCYLQATSTAWFTCGGDAVETNLVDLPRRSTACAGTSTARW